MIADLLPVHLHRLRTDAGFGREVDLYRHVLTPPTERLWQAKKVRKRRVVRPW
jgi:hypothetical protein